jgi:thioredoxin 1
VKFVKVNVDLNPDLASRYRVQSIPTLLYFKDGEVADITIGATSKVNIERKFQALTGEPGKKAA